MLDINSVFSSTDIFGTWIASVTSNFTGDQALTLGFILICLLLLISIFKMPDMLVIILLFPAIVLFSRIDVSFNLFVGLGIIFFAIVIWSLFPGK